MTKSTKSHIRSFLPYVSSLHLPVLLSANIYHPPVRTKLPRPSNHSVATATGSKRSSADSDLLLCHVGLWQTSRELTDSRKRTRSASPRQGKGFGCVFGCEHSEIGFILIVPSAHGLNSRPPHLYMRACGQCVHESARLFRVICSHAWYRRSDGER